VAAGVTAAFLPGCGKETPVATQADTGIAAVSLDGMDIELGKAAIKEFGDAMTGPVMLSGHPQYDSARMIWNGMHDKRPALIARCVSAEDVGNAVSFARDNNLLVAVRGGGHSWPGKSVCDGGLMIDLSQMNTVTADRDTRRARAQGGALLNNLDTAALEKGLITTAGVVSHTGCGGYTLGGGFGRLNRKYGLTIDNVTGAQIITADGRIRRISAEAEPDLFWAIRGGGGNFGAPSGRRVCRTSCTSAPRWHAYPRSATRSSWKSSTTAIPPPEKRSWPRYALSASPRSTASRCRTT
jgi:hypothetical protein